MDRPIGRKVLKFDSRLRRLRVVVAAAPQVVAAYRRRVVQKGCVKGSQV